MFLGSVMKYLYFKLFLNISILTILLCCQIYREQNEDNIILMKLDNEQEKVLTVENFIKIRNFVIDQGETMTYCNMFNDNPTFQINETARIFLNPSSQKYIDCKAPKEEFVEIIVFEEYPEIKYFCLYMIQNKLQLMDYRKNNDLKNTKTALEKYFNQTLYLIKNKHKS